MKRLWITLLTIALLLTGCMENNEANESHSNHTVKEMVPEPKTTKSPVPTSNKSTLTVLDLKKKYKTESDKAVMPLYNVKRDEQFTFKFNASLIGIDPEDILSVHTDINALPKSKIGTLIGYEEDDAEKSVIRLMPLIGVLVSTETYGGYDGYWGNAPIYYIRMNYDTESSTLKKLEKPIIIPFTVKSEVPVPNLRYEISNEGSLKLVWDPIEGVDGYKVYNSNRAKTNWNNDPISGSEEGYADQYPLLYGTVTGTEYDDFTIDSGIDRNSEESRIRMASLAATFMLRRLRGRRSRISVRQSAHTPYLTSCRES